MESKCCEVKGCASEANAILGRHDVCGQHYHEWFESHVTHHEGNEWMERNIQTHDIENKIEVPPPV